MDNFEYIGKLRRALNKLVPFGVAILSMGICSIRGSNLIGGLNLIGTRTRAIYGILFTGIALIESLCT